MDKLQAKKLLPLINNKEAWEALKQHLQDQQNLELRVLVGATSELEVYRSQGRVSSLERLERLKVNVKAILETKDEEQLTRGVPYA